MPKKPNMTIGTNLEDGLYGSGAGGTYLPRAVSGRVPFGVTREFFALTRLRRFSSATAHTIGGQ